MKLRVERLTAFLYLTFAILLSSRFVDVYVLSEAWTFEFVASSLFFLFLIIRIFSYKNIKAIFYLFLISIFSVRFWELEMG
jgi:hypothetical protein